jgi:hypothetical protein
MIKTKVYKVMRYFISAERHKAQINGTEENQLIDRYKNL